MKKEEQIIAPVDRALLKAELTEGHFLRKTNKAGNILYIFHALEAPNLMQEVGRLREEAFRDAGGGTGKAVDIDSDDLDPEGYWQLIVWNPDDEEIIGGYRYIAPRSTHPRCLSTEHYFEFSDKFRKEFLPYTIELGRSFVQPRYQREKSLKALFALDNLWDGLGKLITNNPDIKYLFGKVTMYPSYNPQARSVLIYFLNRYFPDRDGLMRTLYPADISIDVAAMDELFVGGDYTEDYKILSRVVRDFGEVIPPLINAYMNLSPSMRIFQTAVNNDFGGVEETGLIVTIEDMYREKVERHFVDTNE